MLVAINSEKPGNISQGQEVSPRVIGYVAGTTAKFVTQTTLAPVHLLGATALDWHPQESHQGCIQCLMLEGESSQVNKSVIKNEPLVRDHM